MSDNIFDKVLARGSAPSPKGKSETFAAARARILAELPGAGWKVVTRNPSGPPMKVPHATDPGHEVRLYFKPQAVLFAHGNSPSLNGARSLWVDIRGLSTAALIASVYDFIRR